MSTYTCSDMIVLISKRNPEGYHLLCQKYAAELFGVINIIVKDTEAAELVLKQTCQKICSLIHEYHQEKVSFLTWIIQHARAASIAYLKMSAQPVAVNQSPEMVLIVDTPSGYSERLILDMVLKGHRVNEVAQKLNISVDAVKAGVRSAMKLKVNTFR